MNHIYGASIYLRNTTPHENLKVFMLVSEEILQDILNYNQYDKKNLGLIINGYVYVTSNSPEGFPPCTDYISCDTFRALRCNPYHIYDTRPSGHLRAEFYGYIPGVTLLASYVRETIGARSDEITITRLRNTVQRLREYDALLTQALQKITEGGNND